MVILFSNCSVNVPLPVSTFRELCIFGDSGQIMGKKKIIINNKINDCSRIERYSPLINWENPHREICSDSFLDFFTAIKSICYAALLGLFIDRNPFIYFNSLPFHIPEARKRYPFLAKPSRIGHYRKYPRPGHN